MARNVFISFRFEDGNGYKTLLSKLFNNIDDTIDFSEDVDRSYLSDETIRKYLYSKLRKTSITIILLTPKAVNHYKNGLGQYDDWMYDEIRYSLSDRENNRTNALIAVYTPEAERMLIHKEDGVTVVHNCDNLFRVNMMNVKDVYKKNPKFGLYDANYDSYCSLVSFDEFFDKPDYYIKIASEKRDNLYRYKIRCNLF